MTAAVASLKESSSSSSVAAQNHLHRNPIDAVAAADTAADSAVAARDSHLRRCAAVWAALMLALEAAEIAAFEDAIHSTERCSAERDISTSCNHSARSVGKQAADSCWGPYLASASAVADIAADGATLPVADAFAHVADSADDDTLMADDRALGAAVALVSDSWEQ